MTQSILFCQRMDSDRGIPVIDLGLPDHRIAAEIHSACSDEGFFFVTNTGIPASLVQRAFDYSNLFFRLSQEEKKSLCPVDGISDRGYSRLGEETLDPKVQKKGDTKEGFSIGKEAGREICRDAEHKSFYRKNIWPDESRLSELKGFKDVMVEYFNAVEKLGFRLLKLVALSLALPEDYFAPHFTDPVLLLRLLHYSPEISNPSVGIFGAGAHSDYGMLTLLSTDTVEGLEIFRRKTGEWIRVIPMETIGQGFVVNIGDMLERWSNEKFRSTLHRVVNIAGTERFSMPFFFEPNFDTLVTCLPTCCSDSNPPKFSPVISGDYLMEKYNTTYSSPESQ